MASVDRHHHLTQHCLAPVLLKGTAFLSYTERGDQKVHNTCELALALLHTQTFVVSAGASRSNLGSPWGDLGA